MRKRIVFSALWALAVAVSSCHTPYVMTSVERTRVLVDGKYDANPDKRAQAFLRPYKAKVDSLMSPVVGRVARYMAAQRPESALSNLLADILLWSGGDYNEHPDFAIYNMGGIRAAFAEGEVTLGDILNVAPFENKVCFITLSGAKVTELFKQMAKRGGEGLSRGAELEITTDGRLTKALVHGKPVDESRAYRVATLDYLAQGNDGLEAFKAKTGVNSPQGVENNVRALIARYFKAQTAAGKTVDSQVEGRIKIVNP